MISAQTKPSIVAALNEYAKAITDLGLTAVLHQHTGTCVESRDETYAVMESVDTRYVKFGPDVGQLAKGGSDPVKVVKDFLPVIQHMHLKDFSGGQHYLGYSPIRRRQSDLVAILDLMEGKQTAGHGHGRTRFLAEYAAQWAGNGQDRKDFPAETRHPIPQVN
jgi:inosose dehydratase